MEHSLVNLRRYLAEATISVLGLDTIEKNAIGFFKDAGKFLNIYGLISGVVLLSRISHE
jgi:hypothetical protein